MPPELPELAFYFGHSILLPCTHQLVVLGGEMFSRCSFFQKRSVGRWVGAGSGLRLGRVSLRVSSGRAGAGRERLVASSEVLNNR